MSWLNAVEGLFAKLTCLCLKHGVSHSVVNLQAAINRFIAEHNATEAKLFTWRADPNATNAARNRGFQRLEFSLLVSALTRDILVHENHYCSSQIEDGCLCDR